jgi:hypothetical protein
LKDKSLKKPSLPSHKSNKENSGDFQNALAANLAKGNSRNRDNNNNFLNGYLNPTSTQNNSSLQKKNSASMFGSIQSQMNVKKDFMFDISQECSAMHSRKSSVCSGISNSESISLALAEPNNCRNILTMANTGFLEGTKSLGLRRNDNSVKIGDYLWETQDQLFDQAFAEILGKIHGMQVGLVE